MSAYAYPTAAIIPGCRSCHTADGLPKVRYRFQAEAEDVAQRINDLDDGHPVRVYQCEFCRYFHVGGCGRDTPSGYR